MLRLASETQTAFYGLQADKELAKRLGISVESNEAAADVAQPQYDAGRVPHCLRGSLGRCMGPLLFRCCSNYLFQLLPDHLNGFHDLVPAMQPQDTVFEEFLLGFQETLPLRNVVKLLNFLDECWGIKRLQKVSHQFCGAFIHIPTTLKQPVGHRLSM
ncbi:MAG TPA: hypothetical protein VG347_13335 [Verrucomicrobiae bacterium]|nr:hypothetical protein [Verrucomicrobiae bacterium]